MSVKRASQSNIASDFDISMNKNSWVRPTDWVAMPTISPTEYKVAVLLPVYDTDNEWNALLAYTTSGNYTINWGDGSVISYATGVKAEYKYDYTSAVTSTYGATTTRGYRTVLVVITGNLTSCFFDQFPTGFSISASRKHLDIIASIPNGQVGTPNSGNTDCMIERYVLLSGMLTSNAFAFSGCKQLQAISKLVVSNQSGYYSNMFANCVKLEYCPEFVGMLVTDTSTLGLSSIFSGCSSLKEAPIIPIGTSSAISWANTFNGCVSLKVINQPVIRANSAAGIFSGCTNLETINSTFDLSACTTIASAFLNTPKLRSIPPLNTSTVLTAIANAFQNTGISTTVALVTDNVTSFSTLYSGCLNLKTIEHSYAIGNSTTMASVFASCPSLSIIPSTVFTGTWKSTGFAAGGFVTMFSTCNEVRSISINNGAIPSTVNALTTTFPVTSQLAKLDWSGLNQTFAINANAFSAAQLNAVYTSLATVSAKTITVTGNPGTATDNPAIATAKGWTVTG